jgi:hypothetical protein
MEQSVREKKEKYNTKEYIKIYKQINNKSYIHLKRSQYVPRLSKGQKRTNRSSTHGSESLYQCKKKKSAEKWREGGREREGKIKIKIKREIKRERERET